MVGKILGGSKVNVTRFQEMFDTSYCKQLQKAQLPPPPPLPTKLCMFLFCLPLGQVTLIPTSTRTGGALQAQSHLFTVPLPDNCHDTHVQVWLGALSLSNGLTNIQAHSSKPFIKKWQISKLEFFLNIGSVRQGPHTTPKEHTLLVDSGCCLGQNLNDTIMVT